ncbi:hypothetical protein KCU92_g10162, partial [Aureobasidium melanogenum]
MNAKTEQYDGILSGIQALVQGCQLSYRVNLTGTQALFRATQTFMATFSYDYFARYQANVLLAQLHEVIKLARSRGWSNSPYNDRLDCSDDHGFQNWALANELDRLLVMFVASQQSTLMVDIRNNLTLPNKRWNPSWDDGCDIVEGMSYTLHNMGSSRLVRCEAMCQHIKEYHRTFWKMNVEWSRNLIQTDAATKQAMFLGELERKGVRQLPHESFAWPLEKQTFCHTCSPSCPLRDAYVLEKLVPGKWETAYTHMNYMNSHHSSDCGCWIQPTPWAPSQLPSEDSHWTHSVTLQGFELIQVNMSRYDSVSSVNSKQLIFGTASQQLPQTISIPSTQNIAAEEQMDDDVSYEGDATSDSNAQDDNHMHEVQQNEDQDELDDSSEEESGEAEDIDTDTDSDRDAEDGSEGEVEDEDMLDSADDDEVDSLDEDDADISTSVNGDEYEDALNSANDGGKGGLKGDDNGVGHDEEVEEEESDLSEVLDDGEEELNLPEEEDMDGHDNEGEEEFSQEDRYVARDGIMDEEETTSDTDDGSVYDPDDSSVTDEDDIIDEDDI